eukprot:Blabericola_migrator_1__6763@NODE_341_length_9595_cov_269_238980_g274_i0_p3_GENE_NODE_341_length_9595_cov_269_238980_g274_i0NODE_341_length_9595_cov_269_238980_g274_i0_p3_ORF_typecomplete_len463_score78_57Zip/PF02535_22/3_3e32ETRAMP/PF09716_10/66ETRAMP/PF09716_10/3_6e03ETRAMP/PF09716_10/49DUF1757/PF08560_10/5_1DUF1757/PF08560_10/1_9e02DUF1757/PF08560_10/1_7e03_NODE_341_length_9595_cov_269_238980_g274_i017633151
MCHGESHSTTPKKDIKADHDDCSCNSMSGVLPPFSRLPFLVLCITVLCCFLPCVQGSQVELQHSLGIYRGATDISILSEAGIANAHLIGSLAQDRPPLVASDLTAAESKGRVLHEGEEEEEEGLTKGRIWSVVGAMLVMLAVTGFGIALPYVLRKKFADGRSPTTHLIIQSICTAFAAGGFWGLALIHVLLEALDALANLDFGLHVGPSFMNAAYPLMCLGYVVMCGIEAFAGVINRKAMRVSNARDNSHALAVMDAAAVSIALTVHSFFEGMVIGIRDSTLLIWIACISVAGHKWAAAFSLSQRMVSHQAPKRILITSLAIFALATPIGAFVGLPLSSMEDKPVVGIINALSAGVLIFVAGECTQEVFAGHCHGGSACQQPAHRHEALGDRESGLDDVTTENVDTYKDSETPTFDPEISVWVFLGRYIAMLAGIGLVFGMMCLHLSNPGHSHAEEEVHDHA